jgi:Ca2+-transporting ATPase
VPLVIAVVLSGAIHLVAVLVPQLRPVFQTFEMSSSEWLFLLVLSASIIPAIELLKLLQRLRIVGAELGPMSRRARE